MILTEGYIEGYQECLMSIMRMIDCVARKPQDTQDIVDTFNEVLGNIYAKQIDVIDLKQALVEQQNATPDALQYGECDKHHTLTLIINNK